MRILKIWIKKIQLINELQGGILQHSGPCTTTSHFLVFFPLVNDHVYQSQDKWEPYQ